MSKIKPIVQILLSEIVLAESVAYAEAEERVNTMAEHERADRAEQRVRELEELLAKAAQT